MTVSKLLKSCAIAARQPPNHLKAVRVLELIAELPALRHVMKNDANALIRQRKRLPWYARATVGAYKPALSEVALACGAPPPPRTAPDLLLR